MQYIFLTQRLKRLNFYPCSPYCVYDGSETCALACLYMDQSEYRGALKEKKQQASSTVPSLVVTTGFYSSILTTVISHPLVMHISDRDFRLH